MLTLEHIKSVPFSQSPFEPFLGNRPCSEAQKPRYCSLTSNQSNEQRNLLIFLPVILSSQQLVATRRDLQKCWFHKQFQARARIFYKRLLSPKTPVSSLQEDLFSSHSQLCHNYGNVFRHFTFFWRKC